MPSSKETIALRWAQASEEEKSEKRRKHAEAQKRYRAKKAGMVSSEMNADKLEWKRALDRKKQRKRRDKLTNEEKDTIKAKDRERKRKRRMEKKRNKDLNIKLNSCKGKLSRNIDLYTLEKQKNEQQRKQCRKKMTDNKMTDEDREKKHVDLVIKMRRKRSMMTLEGTLLDGIRAKEGMRVCRRFGYLRKYKQRRIRADYDPSKYFHIGVNKDGYSSLSWYYIRKQNKTLRMERKKQERCKKISRIEFIKINDAGLERKEELKRKNRIRVKRHRMKVMKLLKEPVIIEDCGSKGEYELLREKNIREFEKLKKDSGLFD